jgi:hypothetical protein
MKHSFILIFLFNVYSLSAQLQTSIGWQTPEQLVQDILFDYAVDISNVNYTGSIEAIGTFNGVNTTLGIDRGVIMTTGAIATDSGGPHGPNDQPDAGIDNLESGFAPLSNLTGIGTFNAAVLECDFVAISDTVKLEFIFGSDEYPEFVNSQFKDAFAFFISGPGITDTLNIALVPGTSQAIDINSINNGQSNNGPCTFCVYYNFNGNGDTQPHNNDSQYIQYDGFTTPLTAFSEVEPGETYHLTIAIADGGDGIYDSGLFLKTNNLESSLSNYEKSNQIKVYPNPNQGSFILEDLSAEEIKYIEVFGSDGKRILFDLEQLNDSELRINIKQTVPGVYWVKIITEEGNFYSTKFVID